MPYYTLEVSLSQSRNLLSRIQNSWLTVVERQVVVKFIKKIFPKINMEIPYDLHYKFPRGSYVCIRRDTRTRYLVDIYSDDIYGCIQDYTTFIQRMGDFNIEYSLTNNRLEYESYSFRNFISNALVTHRGLLFILPPFFISILTSLSIYDEGNAAYYNFGVSFFVLVIYIVILYLNELTRRN